jgi:acyl-CoA thioesterase FadM
MTNAPTAGEDWPFAFVTRVVAPVSAQGSDVHLSAPEIAQLFFDGWLLYLTGGTSLGQEAVFGAEAVPMTREMNVGVLREIRAGDELWLGARAVSRRRRSFTLELALRRAADDVIAATCRTVQVCVGAAGAVEVPPQLWQAVELLEGRPIPVDATA